MLEGVFESSQMMMNEEEYLDMSRHGMANTRVDITQLNQSVTSAYIQEVSVNDIEAEALGDPNSAKN